MTKTAFDQFVLEQRKLAAIKEIDWEQRRADWLVSLQVLYKKVEDFLSDYISSGDILVRHEPSDMNEEGLGSYRASRLVLTIGAQEIVFIPVGALIFGAKGRVDMVGSRGSVKLLLADKNTRRVSQHATIRDGRDAEECRWMIAPPPPELTLVELSRESLMDAIMEVANA